MRQLFTFLISLTFISSQAQDLSTGLLTNDLELHPMQEVSKPEYLSSYLDPSFGTTIRRITNAENGNAIVPMYSTIQAWNADESLMIVYNVNDSNHRLINGFSYEFIRVISDISPMDLEQIFWDFNDPDILYYPESGTNDFIKYIVSSETKEVIVNLAEISGCVSEISFGNDVQMMSWDSNIFTFRCGEEAGYSYNIANSELVEFDLAEVEEVSPTVAPSGNIFYHNTDVYQPNGDFHLSLNEENVEHACIGKLTSGEDAHFAIAFEEGPDGGCIGDIIAHDLLTGDCFPIISQSQGYDYPQSGTHISSLAHKNTEGGWIAASMVGYDEDGQELLDQELVIAKADQNDIKVCRIGHHRSDENEFDYWGEPHPCISPSGTRILFGSDWSGAEDGQSVDCYVVELPTFIVDNISNQSTEERTIIISPNPVINSFDVSLEPNETWEIHSLRGKVLLSGKGNLVNVEELSSGVYFFSSGKSVTRFVKL